MEDDVKTITSRAGSRLFGCAGLALAFLALPASAQSTDPIKIGVIGEESSVAGASLTRAAIMAADDINALGGVSGRKIEVITYDNHSSAADSVRAFQRAVSQDKVVAQRGRLGARTLVGAPAHAVHHAGRCQQSDFQGRTR
jgi:ABC-type branched-subunit amino acid transport system substrate-binding protein